MAKQESNIHRSKNRKCGCLLCACAGGWHVLPGQLQILFLCTACSSGGRVAAGDRERGGERAPAVRVARRCHGPVGHRAAPVRGAAVRAVRRTHGCPFMGLVWERELQQAGGLAVTQCKHSSLLLSGDLLSLSAQHNRTLHAYNCRHDTCLLAGTWRCCWTRAGRRRAAAFLPFRASRQSWTPLRQAPVVK